MSDAAAIALIHNDAVAHTTAIWDETPVDAADRAAWITARTGAGFPVLVAVDGADAVLGFASYGTWRAKDGFRRTVEHSVYVHPHHRGRGAGRLLMTALVERARAAGIHAMVAGVDAGNTASLAVHTALGFVEVGRLPEVGAKFGRWLDLVFLQLILDRRAHPGEAAHSATEVTP